MGRSAEPHGHVGERTGRHRYAQLSTPSTFSDPSDPHLTAYVLNLRGDDVPYCPVFFSYLFIGSKQTTLFVNSIHLGREVCSGSLHSHVALIHVSEQVKKYLADLNVIIREYNDVWEFLRLREWGDGKVCLCSIHCSSSPISY